VHTNADAQTQTIFELVEERTERLVLPPSDSQVLPGLRWGRAHQPFTPAYWAAQFWHSQFHGGYGDYVWSGNLRHEIAACLLGGHGITYEMNRAAFERLRELGMLDGEQADEAAIEEHLRQPFLLAHRSVRYRFPRVKARYLHAALNRLAGETPGTLSAEAFRRWLISFPGIGLKTASWITRNHLDCEDVAVIDIHVFRAGVIMGLFRAGHKLPRDYFELERRFLAFARAIGADPRRLDVLIWCQMREGGVLGWEAFRNAA
jgi:thermostable 8-oxoguanine DNA glycosylase